MEFGKNGLGGLAPKTKTADSEEAAKAAAAQNDAQAAKGLDQRIEESKDLEPDNGQTYTAEVKSDPSAKDIGLDPEKAQKQNPVEQVLAESAAATYAGGDNDANLTIYSSHPIQNLHLGPYQFTNSLRKLTPKQVGDFEELLELLPAVDRLTVKKLDMGKVDQIVADRQAAATQNFDSSAGREGLEELKRLNPRVGTVAIDNALTVHANVSQTDGNVEYVAEKPAEAE